MDYFNQAQRARREVLDLIYKAQSSHIGSNFSCIDILAVLFDKMDLQKDKFICSKGWVAASVYYFLKEKGVITQEEFDSFNTDGSKFIGLIEPMGRFGLEFAGGSMGYGFPAAVGYALSKKMRGEDGRVYVLMSDGEMDIGTTWEAALIAAHHDLDNLTVIIDGNGFQAMGQIKDILALDSINQKFESFGFWTKWLNGHNYAGLAEFLTMNIPKKPIVLVCPTIKGKGVSFMENDNIWHYKAPNADEYERAKTELDAEKTYV